MFSHTVRTHSPNPQAKAKDLAYLSKMQALLELRLPYLHGRAERVELIADNLGAAALLDAEARSILAISARYHDLGLLAIPDALLQADRALSAQERKVVDHHVTLGGQLLNLGYSNHPELLETIWFHHERTDGKGPLGIPGDLIPEGAKIVALAGTVEAMCRPRPHRPAILPEKIGAELQRCAGTQFDDKIVRLFSRVQKEVFTALAALQEAEQAGQERSKRRAHTAAQISTTAPAAGGGGEPALKKAPVRRPEPIDVTTRLGHIGGLTALPSAVCEVLMLAGNQSADRQELAKAIEQDVALASKVLALANSSAYGTRRGRVSTLEEAVGNLGFEAIKNMATGMAILRTVGDEAEGIPQYVRLWEHSFASALIARAQETDDEPRSQGATYLAGLLHDLGKFVLVEFFPDQVAGLLEAGGLRQETQALGIDHAKLGAEVLSRWNIAAEITRAVREHHTVWPDPAKYDDDEMSLVLAVQVAEGLALALGFDSGFLDYLPRIPVAALEHCPAVKSLDPAALKETVREQMQEMKMLLGMFEERPPDRAADETTEPEDKPPISYVPVEPSRLDFLRLWLEHGRGHTLKPHQLDGADTNIAPESLVVVDLSAEDPRPEQVTRVHALLSEHRGVIVSSESWWEHVAELACGDWHALRTPVALRRLDTALRQAIAAGSSDA